VGLVDALPLSGIGQSADFFIEGRAPARLSEAPQTHYRMVSPGYFDALRIELVRGRLPNADDGAGAPKIAVISESMARQFWPGEDPIGQRAALSLEAFVRFDVQAGRAVWDSAGALREIVGIVRDVRDGGPAAAAQPHFYIPFAQRPAANLTLVARTTGDPADVVATLRADVAAIDADQPVSSVTTLDQLANTTLSRPRSNGIAFSLFAGLALLLATVGVYGLLAWTVVARRHEIGVRLALGGPPAAILRSFVLHGLALGAIGIALGLPLAFAAARLMRGMLFGADSIDPMTWAVAATALLSATTAACWIPGRRAASVDPATVMRSDSF
jgi:putative ABC transport system permease protein